MWGPIFIAGTVLALILFAAWVYRTDFLLHVAGVDAGAVQTVPDRVRYSSMGAVILLTAIAATASLTVALSLVFPHHGWATFLPVGILWGGIVFNFDRWIVSSLDYGPLLAEDAKRPRRWSGVSKTVHFLVRFTMAALVGLVISEPIVLAIFGPEINQQLTAQHVADVKAQTAQIQAAAAEQAAILNRSVTAAKASLAAAIRKTNQAHRIYLCELTAQCHLPPGEVTGVPGLGPQTSQDYVLWQQAQRLQSKAQQAYDQTSGRQAAKIAALNRQTKKLITNATAAIDANNGLLARERALDTLTRQNPGFLLRRLLLWLALMFIDLAPVLLKTFSPPTLYEVQQRGSAVRAARNTMTEAVADADHESAKNTVTREFDLKGHRLAAETEFHHKVVQARPPALVSAGGAAGAAGAALAGGDHWVIGRRWHVLRPLSDTPESGRVPYVAADLYGEYPFEVVVKIIAPPPGVAGWEGLGERRHAQMEMSLPLGHIHENIAEILDCDLDPEYGSYIVTRLYPNTLERYLREAGERDSLTLGDVLRLAEQMLAGLRAAWDRNYVHLDLKPANVALTESGVVKLIDFGLAKHYQGVSGGNYTTTAARFTLFYAPPEQMERRDGSWINRNADVRALGAVIYRMLTGYPPMLREARAVGLTDSDGRARAAAATTYLRLTALIAAVEPVGVADLISYAPQDLDQLLRAWLRIDPEMRCPGNPKGMAERAWLELTAVAERVHAAGEADYPVGPRVTQEPDFTELRARWQRGPGQASTAWADGAKAGTTLELVPAEPARPGGFGDPTTVPTPAAGAAARWSSNGSRNGDGSS
jgi:serine/threonine protein kinase